MEANQAQKDRLNYVVTYGVANPDFEVKLIDQITPTIFIIYYDEGAHVLVSVSKMGVLRTMQVNMVYHVGWKPDGLIASLGVKNHD